MGVAREAHGRYEQNKRSEIKVGIREQNTTKELMSSRESKMKNFNRFTY
jgi:hypothetical protein